MFICFLNMLMVDAKEGEGHSIIAKALESHQTPGFCMIQDTCAGNTCVARVSRTTYG